MVYQPEKSVEVSEEIKSMVEQLSLPKNYGDLKALFREYGQLNPDLPQSFSDAIRHWFSKQPLADKLSYTELEQIEQLITEIFDPLWSETQHTRSKLMNVLNSVDRDDPHRFIFEDSVVTQTQLFLRALKIELNRQNEASRDKLTGLYNRRYLEEELNRAGAQWKRANPNPDDPEKQYAHAVLLFDLDHFKKVNDTYGHNAGDAALQHFSKILKDMVRKEDVAARWGGEEFVVLLSCTDQDECMRAANRFRLGLKESSFAFEGKEIPLTVSVGVTMVDGKAPVEIVKQADQGLYAAKAAGRNQVGVQ